MMLKLYDYLMPLERMVGSPASLNRQEGVTIDGGLSTGLKQSAKTAFELHTLSMVVKL